MDDENPNRPIRPLYDVWLKPRRVFRELAATPVGRTDYLLAAAQGMVSWLALCRAQSAGLHSGVVEIFGKALIAGPVAGILGIILMTAVYTGIGRRAGGGARREQVFHVLAYGGVPLVGSLGLWAVTALLLGPTAFVENRPAGLELFPSLLLQFQSIVHIVLIGWSLLIQVMGFSEVEGLATRRAFGVWVIGQLLVLFAVIILAIVVFGPDLSGVPGPPT
ncbi:MAG: YIP1 family protein [Steroidobacterales bacterium]